MHCKELYPIPFATLVARLVRELDAGGPVYNLRRSQWWTPDPHRDVSITHVGGRAHTPLGPASGPHTQLAQNLVLAWLGGGRFMELKTVQVLDDLEIPRPCIHAPHVGYNVEWSQELRVPQSAREYVKGWMLIHLLAHELDDIAEPGVIFDMSLGYDLAGIRSDKVAGFIASMQDASELIDELRAELPPPLCQRLEIPIPARISGSTTLSTFHGCPADEIESIAAHTMRAHGLHTVVKLNPTLLGHARCRELLTDRLGYRHIHLDAEPFEKDLQWGQLLEMVPRLQRVAAEVGVDVGFKLSNTLVMNSPEPPFGQGEMYLSGPPLHVLALTLAAELRHATGPEVPITFSAGIDARNFADCVAAGLGPVTTCTDLLKSKGYGRLPRYLRGLERRMSDVEASTIEELRRAAGSDDSPALAAAAYLATLAARAPDDRSYANAANQKGPRKVGSRLELFDCLTCDICIPVCPNAANFHFPVAQGEHRPGRLSWDGADFALDSGERLIIDKRHQIGCTADACNLCGECDVWCPEDGGPYLVKPNLFLSQRSFSEHPERDGFLVSADRTALTWRRSGELLTYRADGDERAVLDLPGGRITLEGDRPVATEGSGELDLTTAVSMRLILEGLLDEEAATWLRPMEIQTKIS